VKKTEDKNSRDTVPLICDREVCFSERSTDLRSLGEYIPLQPPRVRLPLILQWAKKFSAESKIGGSFKVNSKYL
jgi:hypothetical protein